MVNLEWKLVTITGLLELGVPGAQILEDQLTLSQLSLGEIMSFITTHSSGFSDLRTALYEKSISILESRDTQVV